MLCCVFGSNFSVLLKIFENVKEVEFEILLKRVCTEENWLRMQRFYAAPKSES